MTDQTIATSPAAIKPAATGKTTKSKHPRRMAREPEQGSTAPTAAASKPVAKSARPKGTSKSYAVIALLSREEGATSAELIAATGWLPHTMRAALTGLRKKSHSIERSKRGEETCYRITPRAIDGSEPA